MRILVTGGAGFIGSNYCRFVLREHPEDEVVNFDKLTYAGNLENLREVEDDGRYSFVRGDICEEKVVEGVMGEVDAVVNFAAETHVDRSIRHGTHRGVVPRERGMVAEAEGRQLPGVLPRDVRESVTEGAFDRLAHVTGTAE